MLEKKPLVILTGPTAAGKTELSIQLAKKMNGEIISADSMQVYKYMDIGTAKITKEEMQGVPHYLVDEFEPEEDFNVVRFQTYAKKYMDEIYAKGKIPIVVGGTGFYIQALLYDIDFDENDADTQYRKELEHLAEEKGAEYLHEMLQKTDEKAAREIHANNVKRVIRALEFYKQTGRKISEHNETERQKESPYEFAYFVLTDERKILYERINLRVDKMMEAGLLKEVEALKERGLRRDMVSMQGIGYKEILAYLDNEYSYEKAVEVLKQDTRHFAKRQLTWFRREKEVIWLDKSVIGRDTDSVMKAIDRELKKRHII
ncbi:tRNA (adenosine(37)-N6)-dimethylallyltransferase MiaA [[Clostridium] polysaccharolyticum]|uniref:tRNA dimethylallyltransferase n=1 Tax=[Clostridium] polysaccharolyticum TaxID=29364 RepID=A0A1I0E3B2_9FIRM|nr:tRNA dimethylallyltransferase [[Clostridium] polysaccharolyticum]